MKDYGAAEEKSKIRLTKQPRVRHLYLWLWSMAQAVDEVGKATL
jgi:hypothetical protein